MVFFTRLLFNKNGYTLYERPHVSSTLIQGRKAKPNKDSRIRTQIIEIWQCVGAMWTDMKMIVGTGWRNGIKNESGKQDLRTLVVLPSNMDIMGF